MRVRTELMLAGVAAAAAALAAAALVFRALEDATPAWLAVALAVIAGLAAGAALGGAGAITAASRLARLRDAASAYAHGDYSRRLRGGSDELGEVLRPLDDAFQALAGRLTALTRDRARMEAILSGMVEGVLVVDEQGVVQLANEAARRALRVRDDPVGRRYVELVRHPDIEAQIGGRCAASPPTPRS